MDLHALMRHVDFTNPVSWVALAALLLTVVNTVTGLLKIARDRPRLRLEAMVQGPNRGSWDEIAKLGDGVTLTIYSAGTKPVAVSHICGERMIDGFRASFQLHQHPRNEWILVPGAFRTTWAVDPRALDHLLWLGVEDTLGRRWKLPGRQLRKLKRQEERARGSRRKRSEWSSSRSNGRRRKPGNGKIGAIFSEPKGFIFQRSSLLTQTRQRIEQRAPDPSSNTALQ